jgi:hypothetical protein|tara:strand:- start:1043 stop:1720 length:678 start_codon:yes stop_codon:yes gene_type:complete
MKKTSAFTLIETMIALVISIISVGAIYSSYLFFKDSYQTILDKAEVNNFGRVAIPMITKDLRNTGYKSVNYTGILNKKIEHTDSSSAADSISIWYNSSGSSVKKIKYLVKKYNTSSDLYLAREIDGVAREIVPNVEDFQVVLKDKQGRTLSPVCADSGCSQKGKDNQNEVHTVEVYLTIRSPNEINKEKRKYIIKNANRTIPTKEDRYHRETFFISVYLRNINKI